MRLALTREVSRPCWLPCGDVNISMHGNMNMYCKYINVYPSIICDVCIVMRANIFDRIHHCTMYHTHMRHYSHCFAMLVFNFLCNPAHACDTNNELCIYIYLLRICHNNTSLLLIIPTIIIYVTYLSTINGRPY